VTTMLSRSDSDTEDAEMLDSTATMAVKNMRLGKFSPELALRGVEWDRVRNLRPRLLCRRRCRLDDMGHYDG